MVLCVEGGRPGLRGPSPAPAPRRLLCEGQHVGKVFSALDGDTFGLDTCLADNMPHQLLRGSFMTKLSDFIHQASADACSVDKRGHDFSAESTPPPLWPAQTPLTPPTPLGLAHRMPDHAPPDRKAARAMATVTSKPRLMLPLLTTVP